jgi:hypothetical protein
MDESPKEKAEQLVKDMGFIKSWGTNYTGGDDVPHYGNPFVKQCAYNTVSEIIRVIRKIIDKDNIMPHIIYWQKVKEEIDML